MTTATATTAAPKAATANDVDTIIEKAIGYLVATDQFDNLQIDLVKFELRQAYQAGYIEGIGRGFDEAASVIRKVHNGETTTGN